MTKVTALPTECKLLVRTLAFAIERARHTQMHDAHQAHLSHTRLPGQPSRVEVAVVGRSASLHAKVCRAVVDADLLDSAAAPESAQVSASDMVLALGENGEGITVAVHLAASVVPVPSHGHECAAALLDTGHGRSARLEVMRLCDLRSHRAAECRDDRHQCRAERFKVLHRVPHVDDLHGAVALEATCDRRPFGKSALASRS